jgi:hypothetical protein
MDLLERAQHTVSQPGADAVPLAVIPQRHRRLQLRSRRQEPSQALWKIGHWLSFLA